MVAPFNAIEKDYVRRLRLLISNTLSGTMGRLATPPPIRVDELREVMHISDFRMARESTVRANIQYMSDNADRNVIFAWQSSHRPPQRGATYGLNGAFPSQMQPPLVNI
ncbi:hypothetical protein BKA61DRAFT_678568 [Leptodontidium sp. MPI-SDFR-AT-0119]|nr:hypothetical protein BKA61DRAFT_678568 [Leptodontidium sp. MPI-SDFR-AT-0119]